MRTLICDSCYVNRFYDHLSISHKWQSHIRIVGPKGSAGVSGDIHPTNGNHPGAGCSSGRPKQDGGSSSQIQSAWGGIDYYAACVDMAFQADPTDATIIII